MTHLGGIISIVSVHLLNVRFQSCKRPGMVATEEPEQLCTFLLGLCHCHSSILSFVIYCSHELSLLNLSMFVAKRQTVLISDTMRINKRNYQHYTIDILHQMIPWSRAKPMVTKKRHPQFVQPENKQTNSLTTSLTYKITIFIYKSTTMDKYYTPENLTCPLKRDEILV